MSLERVCHVHCRRESGREAGVSSNPFTDGAAHAKGKAAVIVVRAARALIGSRREQAYGDGGAHKGTEDESTEVDRPWSALRPRLRVLFDGVAQYPKLIEDVFGTCFGGAKPNNGGTIRHIMVDAQASENPGV
jgi:hypothetical protein